MLPKLLPLVLLSAAAPLPAATPCESLATLPLPQAQITLAQLVPAAEQQDRANVLKAVDPNLRKFTARGGKLILYHGWSDNLIAPLNSVNYFTSVVTALGGPARAANSVRLSMAPGMSHCGGGDGPNLIDTLTPLELWVEIGVPPDRILASHKSGSHLDRTRPLCPYPQVARYNGAGDTNDAANFSCVEPRALSRQLC